MTGTRADIARAEAEAAAARARMEHTIGRLKLRLDPRVRARETWADVRERGEEFGDDAVEFAYERPAIIASVAGVGVLLLLRRPLMRLARKLTGRKPRWDATASSKNPAGTVSPSPGPAGERR